jgi:hypothetical protein
VFSMSATRATRGKHMGTVITSDEYRFDGRRESDTSYEITDSFFESGIRLIRDLKTTTDHKLACGIMREWFEHDGTEIFEIIRSNGSKGNWFSFTYLP